MAEIDSKGDPGKLEVFDGPTMMTDRGFETPVNFAFGAEKDVLALLRARGLSEDAIAAFKSGRAIQQDIKKMRNGRDLILGEYWTGKRANEGH